MHLPHEFNRPLCHCVLMYTLKQPYRWIQNEIKNLLHKILKTVPIHFHRSFAPLCCSAKLPEKSSHLTYFPVCWMMAYPNMFCGSSPKSQQCKTDTLQCVSNACVLWSLPLSLKSLQDAKVIWGWWKESGNMVMETSNTPWKCPDLLILWPALLRWNQDSTNK